MWRSISQFDYESKYAKRKLFNIMKLYLFVLTDQHTKTAMMAWLNTMLDCLSWFYIYSLYTYTVPYCRLIVNCMSTTLPVILWTTKILVLKIIEQFKNSACFNLSNSLGPSCCLLIKCLPTCCQQSIGTCLQKFHCWMFVNSYWLVLFEFQYLTDLNCVHKKYKETVPKADRGDFKLTGRYTVMWFLTIHLFW